MKLAVSHISATLAESSAKANVTIKKYILPIGYRIAGIGMGSEKEPGQQPAVAGNRQRTQQAFLPFWHHTPHLPQRLLVDQPDEKKPQSQRQGLFRDGPG
jgi:hypothetical protein